ncbi:MAG: DUF2520 domain-containing protein [Longimicrobiales bacterium]|nr:DUF2520 domain-containing protein [Longimicrobiales bacterium]
MSVAAVAVVGSDGGALALAEELASAGDGTRVTVYGRQKAHPDHTVFSRGLAEYVFGLQPFHDYTEAVFLAVPEESIPEVAIAVSAQGQAPSGCAAFHLSATVPTEALGPLHARGYELGAFHLLGGPSRPWEHPTPVKGGCVAVTGSPAAVAVARRLTDMLDAELLEVPAARRPLVDAAAVMVGGAIDPLLGLSVRMMERAGIPGEEAVPALVSVARGALRRIEAQEGEPPPHAVLQGDVETVALHLRALDAEDQRLYAVLASEILRIGGDAMDPEERQAMRRLLSTALEPTGIG